MGVFIHPSEPGFWETEFHRRAGKHFGRESWRKADVMGTMMFDRATRPGDDIFFSPLLERSLFPMEERLSQRRFY